MRPVRAIARALLSSIFVVGGARTFRDPDSVVGRAQKVAERVGPVLSRVHAGIPTDARRLVRLNAAVQVVGGVLLATGRLSRPAAAVLAGSLVPTTLAGHPYWTFEDPAERRGHRIHFMKNLGLIGGLLLAAADTRGRPSLGWRTSHAVGSGRRTVRRAVRTARRDARIAVRAAAAARRMPG
ncbi:DoxX family protein [Micromonospora sp. HM5-17]|uniref:DoxX family protein n=1 Tax=Micromonospora sp. HM5-17 TaxID=2487710 RepID=UPI000F4672F2|nr:DoxX family protein [Micromonospora sp. HM5-17]ROT33663.1 DoxX family protein [Micromonospora sp. HM5-17]